MTYAVGATIETFKNLDPTPEEARMKIHFRCLNILKIFSICSLFVLILFCLQFYFYSVLFSFY